MSSKNPQQPALPAGHDDLKFNVSDFGVSMQRLASELWELFPERTHLVNQIVLALLTREHVLFHGIFGTGKTQLVNAVFGAFDGPQTFSVALNKFHTEANVFGIPDPKKMRREGIVHYNREGGLLDAHFAELDEILDASGPLLRVLLGVLNEREFKRGKQYEKAVLHTALASTNGDPDKAVKMSEDLGAVMDRFVFRCKVGYLGEEKSRQQMYRNYLGAARPQTRISYAALDYFSRIVAERDLIDDPEVLAGYGQIITNYRAKVKDKQIVSDRRSCKILRVVQANAVLHGRLNVEPEDLWAMRWGLCVGNDTEQHEAFKAAASAVIEDQSKKRATNVDALCVKLLNQYEGRLPKLGKTPTDAEILDAIRQVRSLREDINSLKPLLASTQERKRALLSRLTVVSSGIDDQIKN